MNFSIEWITREIAENYLKSNVNNRPLRRSLVESYAKDMKSNRWGLTHQGIAFDQNGKLLDGQHRLAAIALAGIPVRMVVSRGVSADFQVNMDDHSKRTIGDAISLMRGEKVTTEQVAVIRACIELPSGRTQAAETRANKMDVAGVYDLFIKPLAFASKYFTSKTRGITSAPAQAAICLAWFYVPNLDRLGEFCEVLSGKTLAHTEGERTAVVLREWLLRSSMVAGTQRLEGFRKTQRAIVAFERRQDISKLYGTSTYYPWPLVDPVRL